MKKTAQLVARTLQASGVLGALERLDHSSGLRVLVYHRIDEPAAEPDLDPGLVSATPAEFRAQMRLIADRYHAVSVRTVLAAQRGEAHLPQGAVLITFDDGYLDFAEHAWPVLRELGLPALLFVPTAFPGQTGGAGFWWDRLHAGLRRADDRVISLEDLGAFDLGRPQGRRLALRACKQHVKSLPHPAAMRWVDAALGELAANPSRARVLDWDSLRELLRQGLEVAAHGHLHALCTRLSADELKADLKACRARLARELGDGASAPVLAYPANASNPQVRRMVREQGFQLAFGGRRGVARFPVGDAFDVMRIPALRYDQALFRAQMRPSIASLARWMVDERRRA